ncbi:protein immune deficiency [Epargyreus clarus]|uniref:protein immune deficiency n=1 Tax=Epargyreus clarus TaxID=520877 RepID=UPI003C2E58D9
MASKINFKFLEMFRNLKSDAVPKAPRPEENFDENPQAEAHNENVEFTDPPEEIFDENEKKKKKKSGFKKKFFNKNSDDKDKEKDRRNSEGSGGSSNVNTQATGNVINIVNSKDIHWGDEIVYHVNQYNQPQTQTCNDTGEEPIQKTNLIVLLLEAQIKPEFDYMDYISKNLGKNWYSIYRRLGFTQGRIETAEIDMAKNGIAEARYQLLLDWVRNDDDGTLGKLASVLWDDGERQIVKELAAMYHKSKK